MFKMSTFKSSDNVSYNYAYYTSLSKADTLIVWLHGLGEGGIENTDPSVTLLANKVTTLASHQLQTTLGGAHILVPQCPTYWMDNDGKKTNFNNGAIIADGTSYYTQSLIELIDSYIVKCKAKKVIIAGCSNGGYMTMLLALHSKYDAYVPICEALPDKFITDEQIQILKDLPMYFIFSLDDKVVDPNQHEIPTIKRLKEANASQLYVSSTNHVVDTSGNYKDKNGYAYMYNGHWSWIYFFNNETKDKPVFQWLAEVIQ
jgi:predicted peptidase